MSYDHELRIRERRGPEPAATFGGVSTRTDGGTSDQ